MFERYLYSNPALGKCNATIADSNVCSVCVKRELLEGHAD